MGKLKGLRLERLVPTKISNNTERNVNGMESVKTSFPLPAIIFYETYRIIEGLWNDVGTYNQFLSS